MLWAVPSASGCAVAAEDEVEAPEPPLARAVEPAESRGEERSASLAERIEPHTEAARSATTRPDDDPPFTVDESLSPEQRLERARELYGEGLRAFDEGNHEAAALTFEEAYAYEAKHQLLFNAGVAWQKAGDCCRAELRFREFIAAAPDSLTLSEVKRRLEDTTCTCAPSSGSLK
ncbi:MAG: hypothetical protein AAF721_10290 [Myxococcota bacterium]